MSSRDSLHIVGSINNDPEVTISPSVDIPYGTNDETDSASYKKKWRISKALRISSSTSSSSDEDGVSNSDDVFPPAYNDDSQTQTIAHVMEAPTTSNAQNYIRESRPTAKHMINPQVLSDRKAKLKKTVARSDDIGLSPAKLWEIKQKNRRKLSRSQASRIKAGWRVRQCLASLPEGETINTFYLTCVERGYSREVDALFSLSKFDERFKFNKNFEDEDERDALTIAIENNNVEMIGILLDNGISIGLNIFHAIRYNCIEGLRVILSKESCTEKKIESENHHYQIGLTPMLLAAHIDNYRILSLLFEYGHRLQKTVEWDEGIQEAWESANERRMLHLARAQPSYITLFSEVYNMNPMKYCMKEIKKLRHFKHVEHEFSDYYSEIIQKLEDFMCNLMDMICSSQELGDLFQYEYKPANTPGIKQFLSSRAARYKLENQFKLLEEASKAELIKFVTHQQCQLALSYLRHRSMPYMRTNPVLIRNAMSISLGLMFPILSIFYLISPESTLGSIITLPTVSFCCHMMSDIAFAGLLLANILMKNVENDYLGAYPTVLEWLIFLWIVGKWLQEIQECTNRGLKSYLSDYWNYSDIILLVLFTISILIRAVDIAINANNPHLPRTQWKSYEPRLVAEGLQAWAYVFVFIRILGITRVDRNLGPLQISLAKMMTDVLRFFCIFSLVLCAFAFGMSELYWYYGTTAGARMFCSQSNGSSVNETCQGTPKTVFSTTTNSIASLFWALFGLLDVDQLSLSSQHAFTEIIGRSLVAAYHVVAIIVMLNMLIAMMSKSYESTSENEETQWKFYRTAMWIHFIRREVIRPPPMNLLPNPWRFKENFFRMKRCCLTTFCKDKDLTTNAYDRHGKRIYVPVNSDKSSNINPANLQDGRDEEISKPNFTSLSPCPTSTSNLSTEVTPTMTETSTSKQQAKPNSFVAARLMGIQAVIHMDIKEQASKRVLSKLIRRYKLKFLINKTNA